MIRIITDKEQWNKLVSEMRASFFHSFEWGEILESIGQKIERLEVANDSQKLLATVVFKKLPLGLFYAQCHKGPIISGGGEGAFQEFLDYLKKQKCVFLRFEPQSWSDYSAAIKNSVVMIKDINPPATMVIDLNKSEEEFLKFFHPKTRYNINLATRKNLTVTREKNFEVFWNLFEKTSRRDNFILHPQKSYRAAIEHPAVTQITICSDKPIASVCLIGFDDTVYYLYGASDHEQRQLMAPYLAQFEAIKFAREAGYKYYDFFGVAPNVCHPRESGDPVVAPSVLDSRLRGNDSETYTYDPAHRYAGVSRFKIGFNGEYREEPGTFDLPLRKWMYRIYKSLLWLRSR